MLKWLRHKFNMLIKNQSEATKYKVRISEERKAQMEEACATCKHYGTSACTGWVHDVVLSRCDG